ncbi:MAG: hypothetical protein HFACDABA_02123 [Anaerolineales bacterium]|nr:hypothetical protein [Anaerolineales bacterium]
MNKRPLILGDTLALLILTVIGFATHGEINASGLPRAGLMFAASLTGWFLLAPATGLFAPGQNTASLWRAAITGFFTGVLTVILRGQLLHGAVLPIFALIIGATTALGMCLWRWLALRLERRRAPG